MGASVTNFGLEEFEAKIPKKLRGWLLKLMSSNEPEIDPSELDSLIRLNLLGELVAKVTYNAVNPSDPFDPDSGWAVAPQAFDFVRSWDDEGCSKKMWELLAFQYGEE